MSHHSATLNAMIKASERAARSLIRDFGEVENLQVSAKGPGDFVSAADRRAEEILYEELLKARPGFGFLMEESGVVKGTDQEHRWIIDPLDGTTNFLHGLPHWCISIGLEQNGEIIAGLIHDPVKDEMFMAEKGAGAFSGRRRLRVSGRTDLMSSTIACGAPRPSPAKRQRFVREYNAMLNASPGLRRFGAAALDLAYVAAGRYEGFWERDLKEWDIAAGIIIVREAGGYAQDIDDEKTNPIKSCSILAANGNLLASMRKVIKDSSKE